MPRQGNREGEFSFEIVRHLGVYGQSSKGWTKEANVVEWNGGNAKLDIREWDAAHTHMSRGITLSKQEMFSLMQILNHCFGKELRNHQRAREQWVPREDEEICACCEPDGMRECQADGEAFAEDSRETAAFTPVAETPQDVETTAAEIFSLEADEELQEETNLG